METFQEIIELYNQGHRYFINLVFDKIEDFKNSNFKETTFDNCTFNTNFSYSNLQEAKFISCNLKGTDFSFCDLTKSSFENCVVEDTIFKNAITNNISFIDNTLSGHKVSIDAATNQLQTVRHPLVADLYSFVPEFDKVSDHTDDELTYNVYGDLSLKLHDDILNNENTTAFTKKCFEFFNVLGDRQNSDIDNLLVVGIYEGLYYNKKCNDTARQLLKGRNKEVYEYWMINGNIEANY